jgi:hypothetical protein
LRDASHECARTHARKRKVVVPLDRAKSTRRVVIRRSGAWRQQSGRTVALGSERRKSESGTDDPGEGVRCSRSSVLNRSETVG